MNEFKPAPNEKPVPPPPPPKSKEGAPDSFIDVVIRTMASDTASLRQTGGGPPQGGRFSLPVQGGEIRGGVPGEASRVLPLVWTLVVLVALGILFLIGYILVPKIL